MSVAEIIDRPRPKLPTSEASLPITYTEAEAALERCERVHECAEWADRAGALAALAMVYAVGRPGALQQTFKNR
jgi:hypothetical protein